MKKILTIIAVVFLLSANYGCKKSESHVTTNTKTGVKGLQVTNTKIGLGDTLALSKDSEFIDFVHNSARFYEHLAYEMKKNNISEATIIKQVGALSNQNLSVADLDKVLDKIYKTDKELNFISHCRRLNAEWKSISARYAPISEKILQQNCLEVLSNKPEQATASVEAGEDTSNCTIGYYVCLAGVTAGTTVCVSGCSAATAMLGIPACLALCSAAGAAGLVACYTSYCS